MSMFTMLDLDVLTCQYSIRDRKSPEQVYPCASTTVRRNDLHMPQPTSAMFSLIFLVTVGSITVLPTCSYMCSKVVYYIQSIKDNGDGTFNYILPMAYASDVPDNEIYILEETLQKPDRFECIMAMLREIQDNENTQ